MRIVKFFLYVIFLTGLFFVAERVDAYQFVARENLSSCFKEAGLSTKNLFYYKYFPIGGSKEIITKFTIDLCDTPWAYSNNDVDVIGFQLFYAISGGETVTGGVNDNGTGTWNFLSSQILSSLSVVLSTHTEGRDNPDYSVQCEIVDNGTQFPVAYCPTRNVSDKSKVTLNHLDISFSPISDYNSAMVYLGLYYQLFYYTQYSNDGAGIIDAVTGLKGNFDGVKSSINDASTKAHTDSVNEQAAMNKNTTAINDASKQAHSDSQNQIDNANKNHNEFMNKDLSAKDKEEIDTSEYDNYSKQEEGLLDYAKQMDTDTLDISMDISSSTFIWDLFTKLINTHKAIMTLFISILSIGVIKLALGR